MTISGVFSTIGTALTFGVWLLAGWTTAVYMKKSHRWWKTDAGRAFLTLVGSIFVVLSFAVFANLTKAIPPTWGPYARTFTYGLVFVGLVLTYRAMRRAQRDGDRRRAANEAELLRLTAKAEALEAEARRDGTGGGQ